AAAAQKYLAANAPKPAPHPPNTYADMVKSAATGLGKGVASVVGLPGDIANAASDAAQWAGKKLGVPDAVLNYKVPGTRNVPFPGSDTVNNAIQAVAGPYHQAQTTPGKY